MSRDRSRTPLSADPDEAPAPATRPSLCAIVVSYRPDEGIADRLVSLAEQCDRVLVVDNGSEGEALERLHAAVSRAGTVELILLGANLGVGRALNVGARRAIALGHDTLCTIDQDTVVHDGYARSMLRCLETSGTGNRLIGCNYLDLARGRPRYPLAGGKAVERTTVITSGSLFASSLYLRVGPFAENYFIDSIDHEYCLRVRALGGRVLLNGEILLDHGIGESNPDRGILSRLTPYSHPPERRYFAVRNTLWTLRRYGWGEPRWTGRQLSRLAVETVGDLLVGPRRGSLLRGALAGALDGLRRTPGSARMPRPRL